MCEFLGVEFGKFRKFFGVNFGCFCGFKILNLREFLGVRHCEQKQAAASFCVAIHSSKSCGAKLFLPFFKQEIFKQKTLKKFIKKMDCFEPFGSRNDEINLAKILNSHKNHKNLPPNLKQNFKSKYQKTKPQFLYLNSFKRQVNA